VAGKQKGKGDDRYLWPEMLRVIREIKPNYVLGENVPGILRIAGRTICEDLEREGYAVTVFNFEAAAVGARHRRDRVFFVAHSNSTRERTRPSKVSEANGEISKWYKNTELEQPSQDVANADNTGNRTPRSGIDGNRQEENEGREKQSFFGVSGFGEVMADTESREPREQEAGNRREGISGGSEKVDDVADTDRNGTQRDKSEYGQGRGVEQGGTDVADTTGEGLEGKAGAELQGNCNRLAMCSGERRSAKSRLGGMVNGRTYWLDGYWRVEPDIPRVATGIKNRVDRLKSLGNMVVPQQVYPILKAIYDIETGGEDNGN
jgi:DNA (cytosine-5)-methyltransferase 1